MVLSHTTDGVHKIIGEWIVYFVNIQCLKHMADSVYKRSALMRTKDSVLEAH